MACRQILLFPTNLFSPPHFLDLWSCTSPKTSLIAAWLYGHQCIKKPQSTPWLVLQRVLVAGGMCVAVQSCEQSDSSFFFSEVLHVQAVVFWLLLKRVSLNNLCSTHPFPLVLFFSASCKSCSVPPHSQHGDFYRKESYWNDLWPLHYRCCAGW